MASTTRSVPLPDGESTTLEDWGGSGPALLCVHGIGSSRASWKRTAEGLAGSYRVYAYDQRGHGDSANVGGPMTLDQSVADCAAVAGALGEPIRALIGHSWGGAVALLAGPNIAASAVVAIDPLIHQPPATWHADYVADLEPLLSAPLDRRVAQIRAMFAELAPVEIEAKVHALRRMSIQPIVGLGEQNGADAGLWDLRAGLRSYPLPLLLLLADPAESVVSADDLHSIEATLGPNATIEVFAGEGHTLHRTAFDRYIAALKSFLG